jgi:phosphatidylserine/phosphatidylglycerophosphate/cardiolipin synthase-like enzyme
MISLFFSGLFPIVFLVSSLTSEARDRPRHSLASIVQKNAEVRSLDTIEVPVDLETCFSPSEPCDQKLIKLIQSAQKSIDVAVFDLNLVSLVHHLLVASKKIPVRILVDRRQAMGRHSLVPLLIKAKAQVRYGRQRGVMHNKFIIVDSKIIQTGSFNYTNHASAANNENQIYLANPGVIAKYKKRFEEIWTKGVPAIIPVDPDILLKSTVPHTD